MPMLVRRLVAAWNRVKPRAPPACDAVKDAAAIRRKLGGRLSPRLLKDVGGHDD